MQNFQPEHIIMCCRWLKENNLLNVARMGYMQIRKRTSECKLLWHQVIKSMRPKIQVIANELHSYESVRLHTYAD